MRSPTLVILAAGMGSRFGGLKQIRPVDEHGHAIIDYSLFDVYRAGFRRVVFLIKHEIEADFKAQQLDMLPEGYAVPEGRVKPWGTGHAVLCCRQALDGPFAVINADDFYGPGAYKAIYEFLAAERPESEHAMVAYQLRNTVTENGYVARGICRVENGMLTGVTERTHIEKRGADAAFTEDGESWTPLSGDVPVSMNFWGFSPAMLRELEARFPAWLDENLKTNPLKGEYFLPSVANAAIEAGTGTVEVLPCSEQWYGMTYQEDLPGVIQALKTMREQGLYPEYLLG